MTLFEDTETKEVPTKKEIKNYLINKYFGGSFMLDKAKDIAKFSCCLLNVKDFDQIQNTLFGKTIIETNGKYYN
jgi:hypothetical protein